MNPEVKKERIARAKEILGKVHHVPIATVNVDNTPHNSPVFIAFDKKLNGYWTSSIKSQHSKNIEKRPKVFLVVFDSIEGHGGLFISGDAKIVRDEKEFDYAYELMSKIKMEIYGRLPEKAKMLSDSESRIYKVEPVEFWINKSTKDVDGSVIRDERFSVSLEDLIS